jgi:hypothetical protein
MALYEEAISTTSGKAVNGSDYTVGRLAALSSRSMNREWKTLWADETNVHNEGQMRNERLLTVDVYKRKQMKKQKAVDALSH